VIDVTRDAFEKEVEDDHKSIVGDDNHKPTVVSGNQGSTVGDDDQQFIVSDDDHNSTDTIHLSIWPYIF
jgi:hypothetical protein